MKLAVTGASGKAGRAVVHDLLQHGHDVLAIDLVEPRERTTAFLLVDLTEFGQIVDG